jgi:hypothetical protein
MDGIEIAQGITQKMGEVLSQARGHKLLWKVLVPWNHLFT